MEFRGAAVALSQSVFDLTVERLHLESATLWALLEVETAGCGFLRDRRPRILYERHVFHRLTHGAYDDGDISAPQPGGYGHPGGAQYNRLLRAMDLDQDAALQSTSWGMGQILGSNYRAAGFLTVVDMVTAMTASEDAQLAAVEAFLVSQQLEVPLARQQWAQFAAKYNGPAYKKNHYDVRLAAEYQKASVSPPSVMVRAVQLYLTYLGFHPGPVDGVAGALTRSAVAAFRKSEDLPPTDAVDDTLAADLLRRVAAAPPGRRL
jgi:hypothetical protein